MSESQKKFESGSAKRNKKHKLELEKIAADPKQRKLFGFGPPQDNPVSDLSVDSTCQSDHSGNATYASSSTHLQNLGLVDTEAAAQKITAGGDGSLNCILFIYNIII